MIKNLLFDQKDYEKIALITHDGRYTFKDIIERKALLQDNLPTSAQENIAIFLPNGVDFIAALFALFELQITAFPLNSNMTKYEVVKLLNQTAILTVFTSTKFSQMFEDIKKTDLVNLNVIYIETLKTGENKTFAPKENNLKSKPVVLLTTSGSTGANRIVALTEENLLTSAGGYLDKMNFDETEPLDVKYLLASPLSSAYGLMILIACLIKSFPLILLKEGFNIDEFYKTAEKYGATHYEGGTTVLYIMEQLSDKVIPYDISRLNDFGFGGSKISENTLRKLSSIFPGKRFWQGYGMTEAATLITKYTNQKGEKLDSVGTAIKNVEIKIHSGGRITNEPYIYGEIVVKGANVMAGYYQDAEETAKVLKHGYLYTGDLGYLDEEGYLFISGRRKNIIIVSGLNVYPEEVETCILDSLLAKDCIVYGEMDSSGNECLCADIVPINNLVEPEKIAHYCLSRLADYKIPKKIRLIDDVEKTASGKTARMGK